MEKLCRLIEDELKRKSEAGLTTANLDTVYKLIDMYKDLKNTEYWDVKAEYYMAVLDEMRGGYSQDGGRSERRGHRRDARGRYSGDDNYDDGGESLVRRGEHYVRGHYSRADDGRSRDPYERYIDSKHSYRSGKSSECKQRLMETLEEYMELFSNQMEEMLRDADCTEERDTIKRYINKIKSIT